MPGYYDVALSIVTHVVSSCLDDLEALKQFISEKSPFPADFVIPKLRLRLLLSSVLSDLKDNDEVETLVAKLAREGGGNPNDFASPSPQESAHKVFLCLEGCFLKPEDKNLEVLRRCLTEMERSDVIQNHFDDYDPKKPFSFHKINVQG